MLHLTPGALHSPHRAHHDSRKWAIITLLVLVLSGGFLPGRLLAQSSPPTVTTSIGGELMNLSAAPEQQRYAGRDDVFQIEPGTPARARLGFISQYADATPFRILLLLNYQQVDFAARQVHAPSAGDSFPAASPIALPRAGELRPAFEFDAPPGEEIDFDLWTEPLAEGFYDLALVVIPDPDETQRDLPYLTVRQHVIRASARVDDAAPPQLDFPLLDPNPGVDSGFEEVLWFGREPHKAGLKSEVAAVAGDEIPVPVNYQPRIGNLARDAPPDTPLPVVFVGILDGRVVPLNDKPAVRGAVIPGRLNWIPLTVRAPDDPGLHQLFVLAFANPYVEAKVAAKSGRGLDVLSSQRIVIEVS